MVGGKTRRPAIASQLSGQTKAIGPRLAPWRPAWIARALRRPVALHPLVARAATRPALGHRVPRVAMVLVRGARLRVASCVPCHQAVCPAPSNLCQTRLVIIVWAWLFGLALMQRYAAWYVCKSNTNRASNRESAGAARLQDNKISDRAARRAGHLNLLTPTPSPVHVIRS